MKTVTIIDTYRQTSWHPRFTKEFPLLMHIDESITREKPADIPWDAFTYEDTAG